MNKLKVTMGFTTFDNWVNEFCIKVPRLIGETDFKEPIDIILMFPAKDYNRILEFGVGHILKVCHYFYVYKCNGHDGSAINIEFYGVEENECNSGRT